MRASVGFNGWFACSTREIAEEAVRRACGQTGFRQVEYLASLAADVPTELAGTGKVMAAPAVRCSARSITRGLRFDWPNSPADWSKHTYRRRPVYHSRRVTRRC